MKKTLFKKLIVLAMAMLIIAPAFALVLPVQAGTLDPWGGSQGNFQNVTGLGNRDPRDIIGDVIKILLGFLGIIAVILILVGGFKWMTAAGNEEKVAEAKKLMAAGVIGLVIILAAFALATFVISNLLNATGST